VISSHVATGTIAGLLAVMPVYLSHWRSGLSTYLRYPGLPDPRRRYLRRGRFCKPRAAPVMAPVASAVAIAPQMPFDEPTIAA